MRIVRIVRGGAYRHMQVHSGNARQHIIVFWGLCRTWDLIPFQQKLVLVLHPARRPVYMLAWGAGGGRAWEPRPGPTSAVDHPGLPIGVSEQAAGGENCAGRPQYNSQLQYNRYRKAQEAPGSPKRCQRRQTGSGIPTLGGAKSRGQDLPSAAWGATGACFYS